MSEVGVTLRLRGMIRNNLEFKKRKWTQFNQSEYIEKVKLVKWDQMYSLNDVNLVWDYLETSLSEILKEVAPTVKIQPRKGYNKWITRETKYKMTERDNTRTEASMTGNLDTWGKYRKLRNTVTREVRKNRK